MQGIGIILIDMEKETIDICQYCDKFDKGKCTMHKIEVCYNDEACNGFIEKGKEAKNENKDSN